ncbi:NUDIX domain-containing protein [Ensifer sp. ENS04]|uniref:NUDIX domain-containing protein n=1 Tax=Ensifer sp. ENS04 TaxID=2769281 RepID=UPI00177AF57E|nr:NUDIX domain-containing protein [Ensifer sp. ENS04]MBD9542236.1 NUDIX domain-containing protein [Ensifer sp. ENS04]
MDEPIAYTKEGRPLFDNTPTVVCMIAKVAHGAYVAVRRNNEPGRGLLGLPGGYHMRGETWQQAGCREVFEETGYTVEPESVNLVSVDTDEYGNNLIIASGRIVGFNEMPIPDEIQEVLVLSNAGSPTDWAFPRHLTAVKTHFK